MTAAAANQQFSDRHFVEMVAADFSQQPEQIPAGIEKNGEN